jgi:hypothetical protein
MSNQKRLEEYLVGNKEQKEIGYLKSDISNGKVIMLSGKWGSGKTHFWKNVIEKELIENQTKKQKAYVYSSLYGNRTLDKIEDNIYAQAYLCSVGGKNAVLSGYEKVKDFGKRFGSFCSLLDVSKLVDGIDDIQQKNIKKSALSYLENGGIVCFDDFERKSKDIDLNDLFGFISHLAIDLNCKVVIILNDDVFEDVEKDVFSRVKEKSVSKFLKYEPSIKELFETIFSDKRYRVLDIHRDIILKTIEETGELNARIYIQVFDNLVEWIGKNQEKNDEILRCLILVNINFIKNHLIFKFDEKLILPTILREFDNFPTNSINVLENNIDTDLNNLTYKLELIDILNSGAESEYKSEKNKPTENLTNDLQNIEKYGEVFWIFYKFYNIYKYKKNISNEQLKKINNFIETGIL